MARTVCEGILLPLITPFDPQGDLDEKVLAELAEFMVGARVHGLFILGSAGQGPVMLPEQRRRTAEVVIGQVRGRIPVITHVGCADTETTVELALHARSIGSAAVAVIPPYYYSDHSDYEIIEHFRAVSQALGGDFPIYLYDNAQYSGIHITPEKAAKLLETVPCLCGIKASYVGVEELLRYVKLLPAEFGVFSGSIFNLLATAPLGVSGAIHPPTSLFPELCVGLWEAIGRENWKDAFDYQKKLYELASVQNRFKSKARSVTAAIARLRGFDIKRYPKWKTEPLSQQELEVLEQAADQAGIAIRVV